MVIGAIIQARMGSVRLPGKVLMPLAGKPLLQYVLERTERCQQIDAIVVATSTRASDDAVADFCAARGAVCWRGALDDVVDRFTSLLTEYRWDAFVRICGDSPVIDQRLIDRGVALFRQSDVDVVTNAWPRSYPKGQGVEVMRTAVFLQAAQQMQTREDREHVMGYFYEREGKYSIKNFSGTPDYSRHSLAVDTEADAARVEALLRRMDRPHWQYGVNELMALSTRVPI